MNISAPPPAPRPKRISRREWVRDVNALIDQARAWASQQGWPTTLDTVTRTETGVGTYTVPVLTAEVPGGRLILEPIAHRTPELNGRVDLYAYPTLARMLLLRDPETVPTPWVIRTSDGVSWPQPWSQETFYHLAKGLLHGA